MTSQGWTQVSNHIPGLEGRGVLFADHSDYDDIALALIGAGFKVHAIDGRHVVDRRGALPAVAEAMNLPPESRTSLDALADGLRDLSHYCPGEPRVVLLWRNAERLLEGDPGLWEEIADILRESCDMLWSGHDEEDMVFETVAFVDGYDVSPLKLAHADSTEDGPAGGPD